LTAVPAAQQRRRSIAMLAAAVLTALALVAAPADANAQAAAASGGGREPFTLTLLHNNDGESQLLPSDDGNVGGVARFVARLRELQREGRREPGPSAVVTVSSGDNFLAGPQFQASLDKGVPFYDSIAANRARYDAMAIGNHEFDFGPDVLADYIRGVRGVPFLSANLDVSPEPRLAALERRGRIAPSTVVGRGAERVGIIGATTPLLRAISSPRDVVVDPEVAAAIQGQVELLEGRGVDKIVLISHLQSLQEDLALVPQLDGVDIVVAGGGDELLANADDPLLPGDQAVGSYPTFAADIDGTQVPVVTTSGSYRYIGRLVADFDRHGNLLGVDDARSGPIRISGPNLPDVVEPDPVTQQRVVEPVTAYLAALAENVIAQTEVPLDGLRTSIRTQETNEGNLVADALLSEATRLAPDFGAPAPDVALQNGGGMRDDEVVPPGPITELKTFDILPFSNFVAVVPEVPRETFKELLENAVSRVEAVDGRFAQIAGFRFSYDPAGQAQIVDPVTGAITTPGTRVREVALDDGTVIVAAGQVQAGAALNVATIDFLARGGDQYPFGGLPFTTLGVSYQQALRNYLTGPLGGVVTAAQYPAGGEGRITTV
jgi:2',3'-cyclic-nucleotide 2'-phosphodiesterase (5'-nucleotidase family)